MASIRNDLGDLPPHLRRACIAHKGNLTPLYEYIPRVRADGCGGGDGRLPNYHHTALVSLSGHLFDHFLINETLDTIEAGGGSFHLLKCEVGQNGNATSYSELEVINSIQSNICSLYRNVGIRPALINNKYILTFYVKVGAPDKATLDEIIDSLTLVANSNRKPKSRALLKVVKIASEPQTMDSSSSSTTVLILGAGRVCRPTAQFLVSRGSDAGIQVIVGSLFMKDAVEVFFNSSFLNHVTVTVIEAVCMQTVEGIPNTKALQIDVSDYQCLSKIISQVI